MTKICYNALPLSAFTTLQKKVFPAYFRIQSLLIFLTAATHIPYGPYSLVGSAGDTITLAFAGGMALLNLTMYGPRTQEAMIERIHQGEQPQHDDKEWIDTKKIPCLAETRDGRKHDDVEGMSEEMRKLNRNFSKNHAMSIHLNLLAIGATLWYGVRLASRFQITMV